jgi:oligoribonuclease (3'-5' exoribonuclease)
VKIDKISIICQIEKYFKDTPAEQVLTDFVKACSEQEFQELCGESVQEVRERLMNEYMVVYYNRFACETQTFKTVSKNTFRAGREFYRTHNRKQYHNCIESISCV